MQKVATGAFRLKSSFFNVDKLVVNRHQLSQRESVSYPTLLRYLSQPENGSNEVIENFSGEVLYALLVAGFGMSPEEVEELRVGDIFEVVPRDKEAA